MKIPMKYIHSWFCHKSHEYIHLWVFKNPMHVNMNIINGSIYWFEMGKCISHFKSHLWVIEKFSCDLVQ